jgi:hypothetical protein
METTAAVPSCATCTRVSDNTAFNCPARMSDGRLFTDYRPRCDQVTELMPNSDRGVSNYEFRMNLVSHAEDIMRRNMMWAFNAAQCGQCDASQPGTMLPEAYAQSCDGNSCTFTPFTKGGLGLGRNYGNTPEVSAARDAFMRKHAAGQAELARTPNSCAVPSDKLGWAPIS